MSNVEPPPPPPHNHASDANAKLEAAPKRKPWSAPTLKIMEMVFTQSGFNSNPDPVWDENTLPTSTPTVNTPTYRTS